MVAFADLSLSFLFGLSGLTEPDTSSGSADAGNVHVRSAVCEQIASEVSSSSKVYYAGAYFQSSPNLVAVNPNGYRLDSIYQGQLSLVYV